MRKILLLFIMVSVIVSSFAQNKGEINTLPDSLHLSLEFASFDRLGKIYMQSNKIIDKEKFHHLLRINDEALRKYNTGKKMRLGSGIITALSLAGVVYYGNQYSNDNDELYPSGMFSYSFMALMGATMLNFGGKYKIQSGINSYNLTYVSKEKPVLISLATGYPAFGLWNSVSSIHESRAFGLGLDYNLYKRFFGYVDFYNQRSSTEPDIVEWREKGFSVMTGLGLDYEVYEGLHVRGKLGYGFSTIHSDVFSYGTPWKSEEENAMQAIQTGVGLRFYPITNFAIGADANLALSTPTFNISLTSSF
ncbi:MAG: hypothetical protein ACPGTP_03405 [Bacteroidia bacterium]